MRIESDGVVEVSTNRRTHSKRWMAALLIFVLVPGAVASTVIGAGANPIDEVLTIVQGIQATLTGTSGSLAALQGDVTAIRTKNG